MHVFKHTELIWNNLKISQCSISYYSYFCLLFFYFFILHHAAFYCHKLEVHFQGERIGLKYQEGNHSNRGKYICIQ